MFTYANFQSPLRDSLVTLHITHTILAQLKKCTTSRSLKANKGRLAGSLARLGSHYGDEDEENSRDDEDAVANFLLP